MVLKPETLDVLNNLASINNNIVISGDNVLRSVNPMKNLMAKATISDTFPYRFGIYDLGEFLSAMGMFENPELVFDDSAKFVRITDGKQSLRYNFAEPGNLITTEKDLVMPSEEVKFTMSAAQLATIRKASSTLKSNDLVVTSDNGQLKMTVTDTKNPSSNEFGIVSDTFDINTDTDFKFVFDIPNFKFVQSDVYKFTISSKLLASIETDTVQYWVALKKTSTFGA